MSFEDELRATMRAHDSEAPTADGLAPRPWSDRATWRRWGPVAAAVAVVLVAGSIALGTRNGGGSQTAVSAPAVESNAPAPAPLSCPARVVQATDVARPWVPAKPRGVDGKSRLVPATPPTSAVVCAYLGAQKGALTGRRPVESGLAALATTLTWRPPAEHANVCPLYLAPTDGDNYLIGLTFPGGMMWIAAPGDHCAGASNGAFRTDTNLRLLADTAYRTGNGDGRLTERDNKDPCLPPDAGRLGQERRMVPPDPQEVVICALTNDGTRASYRTVVRPAALVKALNGLPTAPAPPACQGAMAPTTYELLFRYSAGPPVLVRILPGCRPEIANGNLAAQGNTTVLSLLQN